MKQRFRVFELCRVEVGGFAYAKIPGSQDHLNCQQCEAPNHFGFMLRFDEKWLERIFFQNEYIALFKVQQTDLGDIIQNTP